MKLEGIYKKSGIYKITNVITLRCYIGSSKDLGKRLSYHNTHLNKGKHYNIYLQRAWDKYGESKFVASILEYCLPNELQTREQYWIDYYKATSREGGYNLCPKAYSFSGRKQSKQEIENRVSKLRERKFPPEFGKAISKRLKGVPMTLEARKNMSIAHKGKVRPWRLKKIIQYTKSNEVIREWLGLKQVTQELSLKYSTISMCLTGRNKTAGGFIWKYKEPENA